VLWSAIESDGAIDLETEFRCDNDLVAERLKRFSDKFLTCKWTVNLGRIKERHSFVMGCADNSGTCYFSGKLNRVKFPVLLNLAAKTLLSQV
jgi:hypothetical protein